MTMQQIKDEVKAMKVSELQELSAFILRVKRSQNPHRESRISQLVDSADRNWLSLEQMDERLNAT